MMGLDFLRLLIVATLVILVGAASTVLFLYFRTWMQHPMLVANRLISLHVWMVSASYVCFLVGAGLDIYQHIGGPLTYRAPLYGAGFLLGAFGLYVTAKSQARKAR